MVHFDVCWKVTITSTISLPYLVFTTITLSHTTKQEATTMKLTIIAPEMVYEHEVDPSMQVQDIVALVEAEVRDTSSS